MSSRKDIFIGLTGQRNQPAFFSLTMDNNLYRLKVVLIGDISVGKTSLAIRFTKNKFEDTYKQTIGASFISKVAHVNDDVISFQIWDTAGQERYKSLVPMYLRGAQIALVLYDVTDSATFENVNVWLDALRQHGDLVKTILVANKCDLESSIDDELAETFAQDNGIHFVKASAKSGYNVDQIFYMMGSLVVEEMKAADKLAEQNSTLPRRTSKSETPPLKLEGTREARPKSNCCYGRKHKRSS